MAHRKTLTQAQLDLLDWIDEGCPDGVMEGESVRASVMAVLRSERPPRRELAGKSSGVPGGGTSFCQGTGAEEATARQVGTTSFSNRYPVIPGTSGVLRPRAN